MNKSPFKFWLSILLSAFIGYVLFDLWFSTVTGLNPIFGYIVLFILFSVVILNLILIKSIENKTTRLLLFAVCLMSILAGIVSIKHTIDSPRELPRRIFRIEPR